MIKFETMKEYVKAMKNNFAPEVMTIENAVISNIEVKEAKTAVLFLEYTNGCSSMLFIEAVSDDQKVRIGFDSIAEKAAKFGTKALVSVTALNGSAIKFYGAVDTYETIGKLGGVDAVANAYKQFKSGKVECGVAAAFADEGFKAEVNGCPVDELKGKTVLATAIHRIHNGENRVFYEISEYKSSFAGACGKDATKTSHPHWDTIHSTAKKGEEEDQYIAAFKDEVNDFIAEHAEEVE